MVPVKFRYDIWVVAVGVTGGEVEGPKSAELPAVTDTEAPSAPFITNATCYESLKIYLEWKKPKTIYKQVNLHHLVNSVIVKLTRELFFCMARLTTTTSTIGQRRRQPCFATTRYRVGQIQGRSDTVQGRSDTG